MKQLFLIGLFLLSTLAQAKIQTQLNTTQINLDEGFKLILTHDNLHTGGGIPDLTPLRQDFYILGTERSVNYSIINGQTQSSSTWIISLKPKKHGALTVPAIKVGQEQSTPLAIQVTATSNPDNFNADPQQDIILHTDINETKPYVNQQIIYKVTLYNSKQLLDASYQGPKVDNALVIPLGEGKRYQVQKNNVPYLAEEQNYAIFPQKSGPLTLQSPVFTALIYGFDPQRVKVENKPIRLEVQPMPKQYRGKAWLPAQQIKLTEHYEYPEQPLTQGNTLVRTIMIEGKGIPAQLLPTLHFAESESFNIYPERGKDQNQVVDGSLLSSVSIKVTYLFNQSGPVTIPELKLPWFNTRTGKEEVAELAAKIIGVRPSKEMVSSTPVQARHTASENQVTNETSRTLLNKNTPAAWLTAFLFGLAWLITLGLWLYSIQNKKRKKPNKKLISTLKKACLQHNASQAREALLKWARLQWPDAVILNLQDLMPLVSSPGMKKQIQLLSQALYQKEEVIWHGEALWHCVQELKKEPSINKKTKPSLHLPPINPI